MTETVIKWINDNKIDVKYAIYGLVIFNCLIVGLAGMSGEFLWLVLHLPNLVFANIFFAIPAVYISKFVRSIQ